MELKNRLTQKASYVLLAEKELIETVKPAALIVFSRAIYSVMQSDGNSFCGDVALDSININKASRDEDNILEQIYEMQICLDFMMKI